MNDKSMKVDIRISPEIESTIKLACKNIEEATLLLKENKELLSKAIHSSLEAIKTPLNFP